MDPPTPLRLKNLPGPAFQTVVQFLPLYDLTNVAQCSKTTKNLVNFYHRKEIELEINMDHQHWIRVNEYNRGAPFRNQRCNTDTPNPANRTYNQESIAIRLVPESAERTLDLMDCFCYFLDAKVKKVQLYTEDNVELIQAILARVHKQPLMDLFGFWARRKSGSVQKYTMENTKLKKNQVSIKKDCDYIFETCFTCDRLTINHAEWFLLRHSIASTCARIKVESSVLTAEDLNKFLKDWIIGGLSKLLYLTASIDDAYGGKVNANGLVLQDNGQFDSCEHECFKETEQPLTNRKYVQRVDGKIAVFCFRPTGANSSEFTFALLKNSSSEDFSEISLVDVDTAFENFFATLSKHWNHRGNNRRRLFMHR